MSAFDYSAPAELFPTPSRVFTRRPVSYRRFDTAAEAIRYAIEELPRELLVGAYLEVDEQRFDGTGIRNLYASAGYPLARREKVEGSARPVPIKQGIAFRKVQR